MSLVSASKLVGGIKEYGYRGFQQLPLVIGSTSMMFTIATGSIAHANIALGMGFVIPLYTFVMQLLIGGIMGYLAPNSIFWKRVSSDSCNIIPKFSESGSSSVTLFPNNQSDGSIPSYWLMAMGFFIGYSISNAADSLLTEEAPGANEINHEKRNYQALIVLTTCIIFTILVFTGRFYLMPGCDGMQSGYGIVGVILFILTLAGGIALLILPTIVTLLALLIISAFTGITYMSYPSAGEIKKTVTPLFFGAFGVFLSLISATGAAGVGYGMYMFSKQCGARSSDLFGILSQILPPSAIGPNPVVCTAQSN